MNPWRFEWLAAIFVGFCWLAHLIGFAATGALPNFAGIIISPWLYPLFLNRETR